MGQTGCGKSTVADLVAKALGVPHVSSGDIAREIAETDPTTKLALMQGNPAPEEPVRVAVRQALERAELESGGWVLEGFPRHLAQLVLLLQWSSSLPCFVYLDLHEWYCIERLVARGRPDDKADGIARRFKSFDERTVPVVHLLEEAGICHHIDYKGLTSHQAADQILEFCA
jgi:adenylate kinase family enzyme